MIEQTVLHYHILAKLGEARLLAMSYLKVRSEYA